MHVDLSDRQALAWLSTLIADMRRAAPDAPLLVVGALARDLMLHHAHGIRIDRATEDADFALATATWDAFEALRAALVAGGAFEAVPRIAHRLRYRGGLMVDVIPFGAVETGSGNIAWPPSGEEVMNVMGYREADASALQVALPQGQMVKVVALPMFICLKLLAWRNRHRIAPGKDAKDVWLALTTYIDAGNQERLYADFAHLLQADFEYEAIGAWMAGRDANQVLRSHSSRADEIVDTLNTLIDHETAAQGENLLPTQMSGEMNLDKAIHLLRTFRNGLNGLEHP
ncbi:MAG: nucleotidyl transferase AbiEii/AbiGii toxin family protein [Betaproteobacteria bacterium]|nr:nucleotidyl transferase AbiEii/AbiGii toxin family protein [Betaproteobacteria bacterium]